MALMLRMTGIPSRVVSGFAPGVRQGDGIYSVSDTDAHSWVEVLYPGIGWVTVDPTPAQTPAHTNVFGAGGRAGRDRDQQRARASVRSAATPGRSCWVQQDPAAEDDDGSIVPLLAVLVLAGCGTGRRPPPPAPPHAEGRGPTASRASGRPQRNGQGARARNHPPTIQARLRVTAGPDAARYAGALLESRYGRRRRNAPAPRSGAPSAGRSHGTPARSTGGKRSEPSRSAAPRLSAHSSRSRCSPAHTRETGKLTVGPCAPRAAQRAAKRARSTWG